MKNTFLLLLFLYSYIAAMAQQSVHETVGNPTTNIFVNAYTGWSNNGNVTYSGNAEVQNQQPCTVSTSSAGGNVFLTNTAGTFFEMSFSVNSLETSYMGVDFSMRNYNAATPNELVVEYKLNGSPTYQLLNYQPYIGNFFTSGAWDVMTAHLQNGLPIGTNDIKIRFRQTSATQQFRIDDIYISFAILLPINLTSFSSTKNSSNTTLNWTANSSHASNSFILEKSNDGINFSAIHTQTAKGIGTNMYSYTDASFVANSKAFYRLQMKDVSGTISYSKILVVNPDKKKIDFIASLYPSPATNSTTIALNATLNGAASIEIFDAEGRKVATQTALVAQGLNSILIDVSMLKSGTYVLKATTKQQAQTMNLVVVR